MNTGMVIVIALITMVAGIAIGYGLYYYLAKQQKARLQIKAENILTDAEEKAKEIELQAKDKALQIRQQADGEVSRRRSEISREEDRQQKRREEFDNRTDRLEKREAALNKRQSAVDKRANEIEKMYEDEMAELERISQMSQEDARGVLLSEVEKDARDDMARIIRQVEAEAQEDGDRRAREIITTAIQRVASDHVSEVTTSTVTIPSDEMKGRIIGRNGRNIHAFEQAAGVDVIVDDTPEAVTISCFDPVRREVARRSLAKLVLDGRIHPAHVEKVLKNEQKEVDHIIVEAGEQAAFDAGVPGLHPEITKMLGRLKFRTSYGQNQLDHAVEVARLSAVIASELGANVELAKAAGLLHDLGKAMDHNMEGTHAMLGAEFAKRYGVDPLVVNAIAAHHHEIEQESVDAAIAEAADAISGARPGARRESLEQYIPRVRALEDLAKSYKGVSQSFALQAEREERIFVKPEDIDDLESIRLARDIAKNIEETMHYPGQIKVTVIRETRAVDYAK
ncbi:MAG: ribonuclease Y [Anaerolineae bacterium]|nr:ribonuclease Y [Anaerolineae bacterium]